MTTKAYCSKSIRFMVWLLICAFFLPAPMVVNASPVPAYANDSPANAHVLRRLNSPERAAAIAEAARLDAAGRESRNQGEAVASVAPVPREERIAQLASPASREAAAFRPQSVTEVLFSHGASFLGVPGLTPQRGVDGSLDEGLGFHQDGTARKAGGVAGSSGPSANGQRARSYMQTGLQSGYGMAGYAPGLYGESYDALWGRDDPTRGGRVSGSSGYSRELGDFDPMNMAVDRGLNYGAGLLNSAGEAALSGLVDGGRARLNFRLDKDGYFNGEGDALLPFYDSARTTVYTQLGARSMHDSDDTRWIGNFGLGQRWFPFAQGDDLKSADYDAGMLMLGYNAFFDYDFTRDHQRGGFGAEVWYDWLRLSSNYYFPLSGWKGSEDFDSRFVKERAAEGWDARVKAYLPFYRHVALTGAYSQWYGDHVGVFGSDNLEKDPKVWSYGVEYTPVPLVSGFITQKSTERGRSDTEFGLNFTYHFQMPWEDQISPAKVAELRTVGGSRHEFVDRENKIILEYKAKNAYHIEYLGQSGSNTFRFRIRNGFDEFVAGKTVHISSNNNVTLSEAPAPAAAKSFFARTVDFLDGLMSVKAAYAATHSITKVTDSRGEFTVTVTSPVTTSITLTVQAGDSTESVTVNVTGTALSIDTASSLPNATVGAPYSQTLSASGGTSPYSFAVTGGSLPGGLSLSGNVISGTPTNTTGAFTFTIRATDSNNTTADKQFSLTVGAAPVYGLTQTPSASIAIGQTVNPVFFVLTESGTAVADGTSVNLTYSNSGGAFTTTSDTATVSGGSGGFTVSLTGKTAGSVTVTATFDGGKTVSCTVTVDASTYRIAFDSSSYSPSFSGNGASAKASQSVIITVLNDADNTPISGASVSFSATMSDTPNQAIVSIRRNQFYGLKVDSTNGGSTISIPAGSTDSSGKVTLAIEDIVGERTLDLIASVTPPGGSAVTASASVVFGSGPLSAFKLPSGGVVGNGQWATNAPISTVGTTFPAAEMCGGNGSTSWTGGDYSAVTNLPTVSELQTVSGGGTGNGAGAAAGWPSYGYWTGELDDPVLARFVDLVNGYDNGDYVFYPGSVVCRR